MLDSKADTVKVRSSPEPEEALQFRELLATQEETMKLVAPTRDVKDVSKSGYPRAFTINIWDAVVGVMTGATKKMAGVKYVMYNVAVFKLMDNAVNLLE